MSRDCPQGGRGGGRGGGGGNCYNCGQPGHLSRDCTEPRTGGGGGRDSIQCYKCSGGCREWQALVMEKNLEFVFWPQRVLIFFLRSRLRPHFPRLHQLGYDEAPSSTILLIFF